MMPTTQSTSVLLITSNGRGIDLCDANRETLHLSANHCCLCATQNTRQCGVTAEEMAQCVMLHQLCFAVVCACMYSLTSMLRRCRAQEQHERLGGHPGIPVPNSLYSLCGCEATVCTVSVDVRQ